MVRLFQLTLSGKIPGKLANENLGFSQIIDLSWTAR